jgi:membrane fusion protein (multidrug efflux system)
MKKLFILLAIFTIASCNPNQDNADQSSEKVTKKNTEADSPVNDQNKFKTVVKVGVLEEQPFSHYISVSGKVEAREEAYISPEISSQIEKINVDEGQRVTKGQLLVSLNTDLTEKSIDEVKTGLELTRKLYEKQKNLWDQGVGSEIEYLQAKTNLESAEARLATLEEQLEKAKIRAPFDGVVDNINAKEGEIAMPGARMLYLVNLQKLKIKGEVSESYLSKVKKGEKVDVEFPSYEGLSINLPIARVGSVIDNLSRTFTIELFMNNIKNQLKPNQLAVMKINDFYIEKALVVPSIIIRQDIKGYYVYHVTKNDKNQDVASKVYVETGQSYQDKTMILSGLNKGMKIILEGYNLVKSGSLVNILEEN